VITKEKAMSAVNPVQVQKFLGGIDYPATKDQILETARRRGADDNVMQALQQLPKREYNGPNAVSEELGRVG
jgi:hypothetical protein